MAAAAVFGLSSGARLLGSSFASDQSQATCGKRVVIARLSSKFGSGFHSSKPTEPIKAVKEHVEVVSTASTVEPNFIIPDNIDEETWDDCEPSVDALLLLQKSMLEKQWNLSFDDQSTTDFLIEDSEKKKQITSSGVGARIRRTNNRRKMGTGVPSGITICSKLLQRHRSGYVSGAPSKVLLTHAEVVQLSQKVQAGISVEKRRSRLAEKLGCQPSEEQLAKSLRISRAELRVKLMEANLAREKLVMSNTRLVMSIAKKYDNRGVPMADLVQGGMLGLSRGIERFDASKGYKLSTYVYWWIRQGVRKAYYSSSRSALPRHVSERLSLIHRAKQQLQQEGIEPTIQKIAETLNISEKKIRNATQAVRYVYSLDREIFPSLGGEPGETYHSYIADTKLENNPTHNVELSAYKEEVKQCIKSTLEEREQRIIHLYFGFDGEGLSWEDISREVGLSRERVRQIGLVALEKLKHAARKKELEAFLMIKR